MKRAICSMLWGVPGPVFASALIAVLWVWLTIEDATVVTVLTRLAGCWPLATFEVFCGLAYGLGRWSFIVYDGYKNRPALGNGAVAGAVTWLSLTWPLCCCSSVFTNPPNEPRASWDYLAIVGIHVFGGTVAGFHVEYYLRRTEPAE